MLTGQAGEELAGWAALSQHQQPQPRGPGGQGVSVWARQADSGLPIPGLGRGECFPHLAAGGARRGCGGEEKEVIQEEQ